MERLCGKFAQKRASPPACCAIISRALMILWRKPIARRGKGFRPPSTQPWHRRRTIRARLLAYLTASFAPTIADGELLSTWLAFWSLKRTDAAIAKLHDEIYAENRRALERLLQDYAPGQDHRLTAVALTALVDGLWLELSLGDAPFAAQEAGHLAERWLDGLIR